MLSRRLVLTVLVATFLAAGVVRAQDATRVGVCNPAKVFAEMYERKAIEEQMKNKRDSLKGEAQIKNREITDLKDQRGLLKPDSPQYKEKNQAVAEKVMSFNVWAQMQDQQLARDEKEQIRTLYDKIRGACKTVAESRKLDLVLAVRRPEIPQDLDQLTPDQVRQLILNTDDLFSNEKVDITNDVIVLLNKDYVAAGGATPPAGSTPPVPAQPK